MNAPIAKDQLGFSLGNLSYIDSTFDEQGAPPVKRHEQGVLAWLAPIRARFAEWQRRRAVIAEMATMTDHELADIGLSRADLPRVFDPAFAADYARGRNYLAD